MSQSAESLRRGDRREPSKTTEEIRECRPVLQVRGHWRQPVKAPLGGGTRRQAGLCSFLSYEIGFEDYCVLSVSRGRGD